MDSVASVALAALKTSEPPPFEGQNPRKKSTRISELLLEGSSQGKVVELDAAGTGAGQRASVEDSSCRESGTVGSNSDSLQGSLGGASAGKWRKASKAIVATKVLAGRPKAGLGLGRPSQGLQLLQDEQDKKGKSPTDLAAAAAAGAKREWKHFAEKLRWSSKALIVRPESKWYHVYWFYYAVAVAVMSCWVEPFSMGFEPSHGALTTVITALEVVIVVTFVFDFIFKFCVAYFDPETGMLVAEQPRMAFAYMKSIKFYLDVLGCFPYDMLASAISKRFGASESATESLDWLKLLSLTRAYRVFDLFHVLDYHMLLSQSTLMLLRNYTYVFFTAHWAACVFYHMAQQEGLQGDQSWVGRNAESFLGKPIFEQYVLSLYFAVTVFTAMGDARLFPFTSAELAVMIVYLLFNIFLAAYIIGTVTIMMVQADEHSKAFRESVSHLQEYSRENELPDRLHKAMKEHLEVHFDSAHTGDEKVLGIYPTTIRRRALRHLYLQPIKNCYVFRGCKQRFLDAILTAARVELFLPGVEIITEGDNVVELLIVVVGEVSVSQGGARPSVNNLYGSTVSASAMGSEALSFLGDTSRSISRSFIAGGQQSMTSVASGDGNGSVSSGVNVLAAGKGPQAAGSLKGSSDALAEVAFFTDGASYETVIGTSPVRVLSLPKASWELLVEQFPQQARVVLENVQKATEAYVEDNLKAAAARSQLTASQLHVALSLVNGGLNDGTDPMLLAQTRESLTQQQMEMITRLDDVRTVVATHVRKVDDMRTFEFLNTAATGDIESLQTMISQGISANTADYDGRTGLMLAAAKGHADAVRLLLNAGADKDKTDAFGVSALAEAAKNAHDNIIDVLLSYGATLGSGGLTIAGEMCTAVYQNDLVKLRRLLRAGAPPDACDYDKRSALHIAGAEANLAAVKLLIEEGGADPNFQDRWGNTALDEARRVGATIVMTYLEARQQRDAAAATEKRRQQVAHEFMSWCTMGDATKLRQAGGYGYGDEAGCAFSGLLVAASKGHQEVVEVLLGGMPSSVSQHHAHVAMLEAARMGHPHTVGSFRAAGITLPDSRTVSQRYLAAEMRNAAQQGNGAVVEALLQAGVSGRSSAAAGEGGVPLVLAVEHTHLGVTRRLVEHGGAHMDLTTPDGLGRTCLTLAAATLAKRPNDPRAKAVHEYLAVVTPLAASGASMAQIAAAAMEQFGNIGALPDQDSAGTGGGGGGGGGGGSAGEVDGVALMGALASALPLGNASWEKSVLSPILEARPSGTLSPFMNGVTEDRLPASRGASNLGPTPSALVTSASTGSMGKRASSSVVGALSQNPDDTAAAVAEAWDNLPGTPGASSRGGTRPPNTLRQLDGVIAAAAAADAAQLYTSSVLNEPRGGLTSVGGASRSSVGALSPVPGVPGVGPVPGVGSLLPLGVGAGMGGTGGVGSPMLQGPLVEGMASSGRLLLPPAGAPTTGPRSPVAMAPPSLRPLSGMAPAAAMASPGARASGLVVSSPAAGRAGSGRTAAARLFGEAMAGNGLLPPEAAAAAATLPGGSGSGPLSAMRGAQSPVVGSARPMSPQLPWRRANSVAPVAEDDELDQFMGNLAAGQGAATAAGGDGVVASQSPGLVAGVLRLGSRLGQPGLRTAAGSSGMMSPAALQMEGGARSPPATPPSMR